MTDARPLYNSRLTKMYVEYLRLHYPHVKVESVLQEAGIAAYQLEDHAHWFTQQQVDRFHDLVVRATGEADISRKVGRFAASSKSLGATKQYVLGMMTPTLLYQFMEKSYVLVSRGAGISARKLGPTTVEVTATPNPGVAEKPYQCANRTSIFEALSQWFTGDLARIDHPECFHRGDPRCRYLISWQESGSHRWWRIRNLVMTLGLAACVGALASLPFSVWGTLALGLAS